MTGYDVLKKVCLLLGYSFEEQVQSLRFTEKIEEFITHISLDLKIEPVGSLTERIETTSQKREALIYGCAMMLAVSENDGKMATLFADIYNSKRSTALSSKDTRTDVLPVSDTGGM